MTVHFHEEDLPEGVLGPGPGRRRHRDDGAPARPRPALPRPDRRRRAATSISSASPPAARYDAPNLKAVLADPARLKLYHFARFDLASIRAYLGVMAAPVYCTKTASRLIRTYTDRHGLKDLVKEVLGQDISKQQQSSDWGAPELSDAQKDYAAADVRYLHALKEKLDERLDARGPHRAGPGLLRLPAAPRAARPRRLGRAGHLRACLSLPSASDGSSAAGRSPAAATTGSSASSSWRCRR